MASMGLRIPFPDFFSFHKPGKIRRASLQPESKDFSNDLTHCQCTPTQFPAENFRLVIYKESDYIERKILYDSLTVRPAKRPSDTGSPRSDVQFPLSPDTPEPKMSNGKFEFYKHRSDTKLLGDMIFGTVSIKYKGESLKMHQFKSPKLLMLTKVFPGPRVPHKCPHSHPVISETSAVDYTSSDSDSQYSTIRSVDEYLPNGIGGRSIPMDVPERMYKTLPIRGKGCRNRERKGSLAVPTNKGSRTPSPDMLRSASASSCLANTMASSTSFRSSASYSSTPSGLSRSSRLRLNFNSGWGSRRSLPKDSSIDSLTDEHVTSSCGNRRWQLGMAVLFNLSSDCKWEPLYDGKYDQTESCDSTTESFRQFLLTHVHLIEMEMHRLQTEIQKACMIRKKFFDIIHKAWLEFYTSISLLHEAPRLKHPVWLSLMQDESTQLASKFVHVFIRLIQDIDVKNTNFFISNLLTAVLMHHLAWVSSVAPPAINSPSMKNARSRVVSFKENPRSSVVGFADNLDGATNFPYNPYMAQYLDVSGAVGYPIKQAKTLVLGSRKELVSDLVFLLSYFIRCSEIKQRRTEQSVENEYSEDEQSDTITRESQSPLRSVKLPQNTEENKENIPKKRTNRNWFRRSGSCRGRANTLSVFTRSRVVDKDLISKTLPHEVASVSGIKEGRFTVNAVKPEYTLNCAKLDDAMHKSWSDHQMRLNINKSASVDAGYGSRPKFQERSHGLVIENESNEPFTTDCCHPAIRSIDSGIGEHESLGLLEEKTTIEAKDDQKARELLHSQLFGCANVDRLQSTNLDEVRDQLNNYKRSDSCLHNLGRSMLVGVSPKYGRHFSLSGLVSYPSDIYAVVNDELRLISNLEKVIGEQTGALNDSESVCVVANTSDWTVKVLSSSSHDYTLKDSQCDTPSQAVISMVENAKGLNEMSLAPDFCLSFIEDCLADLYSRSCALAEFVESQSETVDTSHVSGVVGCDWSDMPLLMAVASVHSPQVLCSLNR